MSTLPNRCLRALDEPRDVRLLRHVGDDCVNFAARRRGELGAGAFYRFGVTAADRDAHPLLEELPRGLPPYAAAAAGDDRRSALDAEVQISSHSAHLGRLPFVDLRGRGGPLDSKQSGQHGRCPGALLAEGVAATMPCVTNHHAAEYCFITIEGEAQG